MYQSPQNIKDRSVLYKSLSINQEHIKDKLFFLLSFEKPTSIYKA